MKNIRKMKGENAKYPVLESLILGIYNFFIVLIVFHSNFEVIFPKNKSIHNIIPFGLCLFFFFCRNWNKTSIIFRRLEPKAIRDPMAENVQLAGVFEHGR